MTIPTDIHAGSPQHELDQLRQRVRELEQQLTQHTRIEQALHETEARFQRTVANVPGMVYQFILHQDGRTAFPFASDGCRGLFDVEPQDLERDAMTIIQLIHPEDLPNFQQSVARSAETLTPWQWEGRFVLSSGQQKWIQGASRPARLADGAVLWDGLLMDITERMEAAAEARKTQHLLQAIVEHIPHMIILKDARELRFLRFNQAGEDLLGYTRADLLGKNDHDFFPQAEADFFASKDREVLRSGQVVDISEETVQTLYHGTRLLHTKKIPIRIEGTEPEYLLVISEDITERRQIELALQRSHSELERQVAEQTAALRASEKQLRAVLGNVPIVIYALDRNGVFTLSDGKGLTSLGLAPNQIVGTSVFDLYRDIPETLDRLRAVLAGKTQIWFSELGNRIYNNHAMPLWNEQNELDGLIGIAVDITEQKQAEQERAQLQEEIIRVQEATLRELSTPLIPINKHVVAMPLIGTMDSRRAQQVLETLLEGVTETHARVAILDITGVPVVDTQVANALLRAAQAVQLLGAQTVLTGIRPEVAQTLVGLGVNLGAIVTRGTLQSGIAYAMTMVPS